MMRSSDLISVFLTEMGAVTALLCGLFRGFNGIVRCAQCLTDSRSMVMVTMVIAMVVMMVLVLLVVAAAIVIMVIMMIVTYELDMDLWEIQSFLDHAISGRQFSGFSIPQQGS